jgi:branched-chain amino acid transport system ATP-binding protein
MLLNIEGLTKKFGAHAVISGIDFTADAGQLLGIIGPNGSGKTTFFNLISGVYKPSSGRLVFDGIDITNMPAHAIARHGIARTFQMLRIFGDMTVMENIMVGHHLHVHYGTLAASLGLPRVRKAEKQAREEVYELLEFIGLVDYADMPASDMSIGQRRLLALGRAVAMNPKMLMLDEPAAGLSPVNVDRVMDTVVALQRRYGLTVVIIEHILKVVMDICQRVSVFDHGQKIAEGSPEQIRDAPSVIEAYLGKQMDDQEIRRALQDS